MGCADDCKTTVYSKLWYDNEIQYLEVGISSLSKQDYEFFIKKTPPLTVDVGGFFYGLLPVLGRKKVEAITTLPNGVAGYQPIQLTFHFESNILLDVNGTPVLTRNLLIDNPGLGYTLTPRLTVTNLLQDGSDLMFPTAIQISSGGGVCWKTLMTPLQILTIYFDDELVTLTLPAEEYIIPDNFPVIKSWNLNDYPNAAQLAFVWAKLTKTKIEDLITQSRQYLSGLTESDSDSI